MPYWQPYLESCISPVFDAAERLLLADIENGRMQRDTVELDISGPFCRARELSGLGVDVLICGAISRTMEIVLIGKKIQVIGFVYGPVEEILMAFIDGQLSDGRFLMSEPHRGRRR